MAGRHLQSYYKLLFDLSFKHKYSLRELEDLPVFELELYRDLIVDHQERERQAAAAEQ
jgi:hypothetical protein